jgi:hypothetical protein
MFNPIASITSAASAFVLASMRQRTSVVSIEFSNRYAAIVATNCYKYKPELKSL